MNAALAPGQPVPNRSRRGLVWKVPLVVLLLLALAIGLPAEYILHHAEPILRKRITETLAARFNAPVTLDSLHISLFGGIEVAGNGLQIGYSPGTVPLSPAGPMISVVHFRFRTGLRTLIGDTLAHRPLHIANVLVEGLDLHIPPPGNRDDLQRAKTRESNQYAVIVNHLDCQHVRLFIESAKPDAGPGSDNGHKPPLEFSISTLALQNVGKHQAMRYDAQLINPKPAGAIHAVGHLGPWAAEDPEEGPGNTPIDGDYTFDHANLNTIKGIGGTLSSTGHFTGVLNRITIDGRTDTPDFSLDIANHPTSLQTEFHALVDGTTGDTWLQPVHALLGGSAFTTSGKIVKVRGKGHDIQLDVDIPRGRMADFLRLAIKTSPPLLNGILSLHARLHIPPGDTPVPHKMSLAGQFSLTAVQFNNPRWQDKIDGLSARASGHPEQANGVSSDHRAETDSRLAASFTLDRGILSVADMRYSLPGALVLMNGVYSTDGRLFEFKGHVRTDATASQMVGGWRGLLLSPLDRFLQKHGAGLELPVEVSGTQGDLHFGLALNGADNAPAQLLTDIREKAAAKQQLSIGRGLLTGAQAEDLAAAQATTLEEAGRHHNNAVRLRAEAQAKAAAAASVR